MPHGVDCFDCDRLGEYLRGDRIRIDVQPVGRYCQAEHEHTALLNALVNFRVNQSNDTDRGLEHAAVPVAGLPGVPHGVDCFDCDRLGEYLPIARSLRLKCSSAIGFLCARDECRRQVFPVAIAFDGDFLSAREKLRASYLASDLFERVRVAHQQTLIYRNRSPLLFDLRNYISALCFKQSDVISNCHFCGIGLPGGNVVIVYLTNRVCVVPVECLACPAYACSK